MYYSSELHVINQTADEDEAFRLRQLNKYKHGQKLLQLLQGDWTSNHVYHYCSGPGCCNNDADAAAKIFDCLVHVMGRALPVPALNKWTAIHPVVCQVGLGCCIHGLFQRACEYAHTLTVPELAYDVEYEDVPADDGAAIGLPRDERRAQQAEKRARSKKSLSWVKSPSMVSDLIMWIVISRSVMRLHFFLFRDASNVHYQPDQQQPDRLHPIYDFTDTHGSRAVQALKQLSALMMCSLPGHADGWKVMYNRYGVRWPHGSLTLARKGLCLIYGSLWRRLVWFWRRPPWCWAKIVNPGLPLEEGQGKHHDS